MNANSTRRRNRRNKNRAGGAPTLTKVDPTRTALLKTPLFPIVVKERCQLYYERIGFSAPTSGNAVQYVFTANGMFDPNITGTGHQPMGFDQMMSLYNQYTVYHSAITVTFHGDGLAIRGGVALSPDGAAITDPTLWMENGLLNSHAIVMDGTNLATQAFIPQIRLDCDVKKYFGRRGDKDLLDDRQLAGTAAANPAEQVYFAIVAWQLNADGTTSTSIGVDVLIEYDAFYWEPRKESVSLSSGKTLTKPKGPVSRAALREETK